MAEMRVVRPHERDRSTAQTPGMDRAEGVGACTVGASSIWAGHVTVGPGVKSGAHHHGETESAIYIISGRARFRYGDHLEHTIEANAGDFIYVPPYIVHQEINASDDEPVEMIVTRGSQENIVVNVDIPEAKGPS
ncbi:MAG TPA: cupin domain-containing protein [Dehalococcoidia bacterium]|nr:cupin domain-containing protein [Dehalococcoidia bacterium]